MIPGIPEYLILCNHVPSLTWHTVKPRPPSLLYNIMKLFFPLNSTEAKITEKFVKTKKAFLVMYDGESILELWRVYMYVYNSDYTILRTGMI